MYLCSTRAVPVQLHTGLVLTLYYEQRFLMSYNLSITTQQACVSLCYPVSEVTLSHCGHYSSLSALRHLWRPHTPSPGTLGGKHKMAAQLLHCLIAHHSHTLHILSVSPADV